MLVPVLLGLSQENTLDTRNGFKAIKFGMVESNFANLDCRGTSSQGVKWCAFLTTNEDLKKVFQYKFQKVLLGFDKGKLDVITLGREFYGANKVKESLNLVSAIGENFDRIVGVRGRVVGSAEEGNLGLSWSGKRMSVVVRSYYNGMDEPCETMVIFTPSIDLNDGF